MSKKLIERHYCDRCGKEIPNKLKSESLIYINGYSRINFNDEGRVSVSYNDQNELCVNCSNSFKRWWVMLNE